MHIDSILMISYGSVFCRNSASEVKLPTYLLRKNLQIDCLFFYCYFILNVILPA